MANVILENRTKRPRKMLVLNLTKTAAPVKISTVTTVQDRHGNSRKKYESKLVPDSLRIPYGKSVEVDESIVRCPEVARAIKARELIARSVEPASSSASSDKPKQRRRRSA